MIGRVAVYMKAVRRPTKRMTKHPKHSSARTTSFESIACAPAAGWEKGQVETGWALAIRLLLT
jgi:hypothetical protein